MTTQNKNPKLDNLEFDEIKQNFIRFLKSQQTFKDYNFEGSGFDVILNTLAYNTHYMGMYAHMLANESFIDSAFLRQSVLSKAKLMAYTPKNSVSSVAEIQLEIKYTGPTPPPHFLIKSGVIVSSNLENTSLGIHKFSVLDDVIIFNSNPTTPRYVSDSIFVFEGTPHTEKHKVDLSQLNQRFILSKKNVDYRTIQVKVYPNETYLGSETYTAYHLADSFMEIDENTPVFFLTTNEDEHYELKFGREENGHPAVYGLPLQHDNIIEVSYLECSGEESNGIDKFKFTGIVDGGYPDSDISVKVNVISPSDGGRGGETLNELKHNVAYHYKRQDRIVTSDDYKHILLAEYPNISSINVWGGEENEPKEYGTVLICIKPKYGEVLSDKAKRDIERKILNKYSVMSIRPKIVDADYLYLNLDMIIKFKPEKTNRTHGELSSKVIETIQQYNANYVSKFDGMFSSSRLSSIVLDIDDSIITITFDITLEKRFIPVFRTNHVYTIVFNHPLKPGTIVSTEFMYGQTRTKFYDDGDGNLYLNRYYAEDNKWKLDNMPVGNINYDKGVIKTNSLSIDSAKNGIVSVFAEPTVRDFYSYQNNLIGINKTKVKTIEHKTND